MCSPASWMESTPEHYGIPVNEKGEGPVDAAEAVRTECWCGSRACTRFYPRDLPAPAP